MIYKLDISSFLSNFATRKTTIKWYWKYVVVIISSSTP